ncbi:MAG: o-succinylbenzoate--CoA ligase [Candidatus Sericytochromatia bacterium]
MLSLETPAGFLPHLDYRVRVASHWFQAHGLKPGEVVALSGRADPAYLIAILALWQLGAIVLPLNPRLPGSGIAAALEQAGARCWVGGAPGPVKTLDWKDMPESGRQAAGSWSLAPEQPLTLIQTSGSSGSTKLALHTWQNHCASADGSYSNIRLDFADRWLLALPLFHVGGLAIVCRCLRSAATLCLPEPGQDLGEAILQLKPTHLSLVATQLQRLLEHETALPGLLACKAILLGGSAIPAALLERAANLDLPIHTSYGSTEMSSQITCTPPGGGLEDLLTSGYVLPFRELRISAGEIQVRGQTLFQGYYAQGRPHLPLTPDGWFATRDRGFFDAAGRLHVIGRLDNMFISGGENIQPEEVEAALLSLAGITQAIVVPVTDQEYGQRPVAFVEASDWQPEDWRAQLRALLPSYKRPDAFYPWPADQIGLKPSRATFQAQAAQNP